MIEEVVANTYQSFDKILNLNCVDVFRTINENCDRALSCQIYFQCIETINNIKCDLFVEIIKSLYQHLGNSSDQDFVLFLVKISQFLNRLLSKKCDHLNILYSMIDFSIQNIFSNIKLSKNLNSPNMKIGVVLFLNCFFRMLNEVEKVSNIADCDKSNFYI